MTALYTLTRFGNAKTVTRDVEMILGRLPISFDQFAEDYRMVWQQDPVAETVPSAPHAVFLSQPAPMTNN